MVMTEVAEPRIEAEADQRELVILDERLFRPPASSLNLKKQENSHSIRLDRDSYIFCFEGRRGGGKTTTMTFTVVKAVARYNMKVISNYPIEFMMRRFRPDGKSYLQHIQAEPLDFEKLICFDEGYKHVLICLDESPDIISHMASQSWRNRLVAAFTRQLRKNFNTLFLGAQDFELIDKSMRWQVDIIIECKDAARYLGDNTGLDAGEMIWLNWFDNSGQWTGMSTEDRFRQKQSPYVKQTKLFPRILWGDKGHKPVFDSWHQIDILDSLRKVDLRLTPLRIEDSNNGNGHHVSTPVLYEALRLIGDAYQKNKTSDNFKFFQPNFYRALGMPRNCKEKTALGQLLSGFNLEGKDDSSSEKRIYILDNFDMEGFEQYVKAIGAQS